VIERIPNFVSNPEGLTQEDLLIENEGQITDFSQLKVDVAEVVKRGSED
jgi:hypothetical protein